MYWQEPKNKVFLQVSGSLGSMQLIVEGDITISEQVYKAQLSIKNHTQTASFFRLQVQQLLAEDLISFKQLLANGFTQLLFHTDQKLEKVEYIDYYIFYRDIRYHLDPDFGLLALGGVKNTTQQESFVSLLKGIAIDLRSYSHITKKTENTLQLSAKKLVDIAPEARLLMQSGEAIMGLLPITPELNRHIRDVASFSINDDVFEKSKNLKKTKIIVYRQKTNSLRLNSSYKHQCFFNDNQAYYEQSKDTQISNEQIFNLNTYKTNNNVPYPKKLIHLYSDYHTNQTLFFANFLLKLFEKRNRSTYSQKLYKNL